jgi:hypothetical protein
MCTCRGGRWICSSDTPSISVKKQVVLSRRGGERQLIAEEIVKLEIWPGGSRALTQPKLLRPIGVAVFTSYREDAKTWTT